MKRIIAFVKSNMTDDVIFALHEIGGFPGASISEVQAIGRGSCGQGKPSAPASFRAFPKSIRFEIVCLSAQVEEIVETIRKNAHTGLPDDGKIYVSAVEDAVRIRTGERGNSAV